MKLCTISLVLLFTTIANCQLWEWGKPTEELERNILRTINEAVAKMTSDSNREKYKDCDKVKWCGINGDKRGIVLETVGNESRFTQKVSFSKERLRYFGVYYLVTDKPGVAASKRPEPLEIEQNGSSVAPPSGIHDFDKKIWSGGNKGKVILTLKFTVRLDDFASIQKRIEDPSLYYLTLGVKNLLKCLTVVGIPSAVHSVRKELITENVELSDTPIPATMATL